MQTEKASVLEDNKNLGRNKKGHGSFPERDQSKNLKECRR